MRTRWILVAVVVVAAFLVAAGLLVLNGRTSSEEVAEIDRPLIVLDAGHGGRDPGAVCGGVHEADINLSVLKRVAALIEAGERFSVKTTRTVDVYVTLEDRVMLANDTNACLYLSIQSNACDYPEVTGIETLVSDVLDPGDPSWQFAEILQDNLTEATHARDRGVRSQDLYLQRATMPAALVEIGFLTNEGERRLLLDPEYQQTVAQGIYNGIVAYIEFAQQR